MIAKKQELKLLQELGENSVLFDEPIIMWSQDGKSYFQSSEHAEYFSDILKHKVVEGKKYFKTDDLKSLLPDGKVISFS